MDKELDIPTNKLNVFKLRFSLFPGFKNTGHSDANLFANYQQSEVAEGRPCPSYNQTVIKELVRVAPIVFKALMGDTWDQAVFQQLLESDVLPIEIQNMLDSSELDLSPEAYLQKEKKEVKKLDLSILSKYSVKQESIGDKLANGLQSLVPSSE